MKVGKNAKNKNKNNNFFCLKNELIKIYLSKTNVDCIHLNYAYLIGE